MLGLSLPVPFLVQASPCPVQPEEDTLSLSLIPPPSHQLQLEGPHGLINVQPLSHAKHLHDPLLWMLGHCRQIYRKDKQRRWCCTLYDIMVNQNPGCGVSTLCGAVAVPENFYHGVFQNCQKISWCTDITLGFSAKCEVTHCVTSPLPWTFLLLDCNIKNRPEKAS